MQDNPLISVITVVLNEETFLEKTILSVINQTYKNIEYIIIDGGSTDGTLEIIKKYEDKISHWVSEKDKGIYDAMNKSIKLAGGDFFIFMNASDTFTSNDILKFVIKKIDTPEIKIICGGNNVLSAEGKVLSCLKPLNFTKKNLNRFATRVVCHQSIIVHKSIMTPFSNQFEIQGDLNWYYALEKK